MDTNVNYDDYTTDEELDNYNEVFIESDKNIENENYNSETPVRNLNGFDKDIIEDALKLKEKLVPPPRV